MTIAWLGTGLLGSGFVDALLEKGEKVAVWNRSAAKAHPLAVKGARLATSPADAVMGATRVHLCLSDDAVVDAVLEQVLAALAPGATIFDHTTVSPAGARRRQAMLTERGIAFLSCPVFMAPASARSRTGFMLVSAAPALVERWSGTLKGMTGELLLYGEDAGHAATIKLVGNAMIIAMTAGLADVLAMAKAQGVSAEDAVGLFAKFPLGNVALGRGAKMSKGDYTATFELTMARKDVSLMIGASGDATLALLPALLDRADALIAKGHGQRDLAAYSIETIPPR